MHTPRSARSWSSAVVVALLLAAAAVALAPSAARAGLGDLAKKRAAQALGNRTGQTNPASSGSGPQFDETMLELNAARIESVIKAVRAGESAVGDRAPLVARRKKLQDQMDAINDKYSTPIAQSRERHDAAEDCWETELHAKTRARQKEMEKRAQSDPAMQAHLMMLAQRMAQAQAAGDSVALVAAQTEMMNMAGASHEDSVAAKQKCGAVPPLHPMAAQLDSLSDVQQDVDQRLREMDEKSMSAQVNASGMTESQLAMAKERILLYLEAARSNQPPRGFSGNEQKALDSHRSDLQATMGKYLD